MKIPILEDIKQAQVRLRGMTVRTPLIRSYTLSERMNAMVFLKPENLQRTGSFKFRGAYNAVSQLTEMERERGVLATSSGNHAQGIAEAARLLGVAATIIMPSDAPDVKIARTKASGAEIILFDRKTDDRDERARLEIEKTGAAYIHPYNNANVIAGQGTVGMEIVEDLKAQNLVPDNVLVCTGGGGLTAGIALACGSAFPATRIFATEPEGFDDYARSLASGKMERNAQTSGSVCDAILTPSPGDIGFEINRKRLAGGLTVSDQEALEAVRFCFEQHRMVVEPGGAVTLAALLSGKLEAHLGDLRGQIIVVTLSGGNIDENVFRRALARRS
ncbi:MAG: threonine/serine dehydratase [Hyphomicrobiales bacterium]